MGYMVFAPDLAAMPTVGAKAVAYLYVTALRCCDFARSEPPSVKQLCPQKTQRAGPTALFYDHESQATYAYYTQEEQPLYLTKLGNSRGWHSPAAMRSPGVRKARMGSVSAPVVGADKK